MAAPLVKTKTPGVYRRGNRYAVQYRGVDGRQRRESAPTYDAARALKARREADVRDGMDRPSSRVSFGDYALDWIDRYQGTGRRGFRDQTRDGYRRALETYAVPFFDTIARRGLVQIGPQDVSRFVAWLCDDQAQGKRVAAVRRGELEAAGRFAAAELVQAIPITLADSTVRGILAPVRSCLRTAMREGLIRHNPCTGVALPSRDLQRAAETGEDDQADRRALSREQLTALLEIAPTRPYGPLIQVMAATGVRISEALGLQWKSVVLDGSQPRIRVRRGYVKGRFNPTKTGTSRRDVPISHDLVVALRSWHRETEHPAGQDLVFCAPDGRPLHDRNLSARWLKPLAEEVEAGWMGWHTLRHTCASLLFASGRNAVQVQHWLGHHSAAFTLSTYVHLLDDDLGSALDLSSSTMPGVTKVEASQPDMTVDLLSGGSPENQAFAGES